jgi:hypothetical protein
MVDGLFDDLLGGGEEESDIDPAPHGRDFSLKMADVHEVQRGVTVAWLCQAFTLGRNVVLAKLAGCPAMRTMKHGGKVYDLRIAATYLVKPKLNVATYIKNLDPADLPEKLKREFWAARLAEQRWRRQAGELWASEDVIAVFGEVFKLIKSKTQLWADEVDSIDTLSDPQREKIVDLVTDLLGHIFKSLEDLETAKATPSQIAEGEDDQEEVD